MANSWIGLGLLFLSLVLDGFVGQCCSVLCAFAIYFCPLVVSSNQRVLRADHRDVRDSYVTGPNQERIIKHHNISQSQLQTWLNFWAVAIVFPGTPAALLCCDRIHITSASLTYRFVWLCAVLMLTDGLFPAIEFCQSTVLCNVLLSVCSSDADILLFIGGLRWPEYPQIVVEILAFSVASAVGQAFVRFLCARASAPSLHCRSRGSWIVWSDYDHAIPI